MKKLTLALLIILLLTGCKKEKTDFESHTEYFSSKTGYTIEYPFYRMTSILGGEEQQLIVSVDLENDIVEYLGIDDLSSSEFSMTSFYYYKQDSTYLWNRETPKYNLSSPVDKDIFNKLHFPFEIEKLDEFSVNEDENGMRVYTMKGIYSSFNFNTKYFDNFNEEHLETPFYESFAYGAYLRDLEVEISVMFNTSKGYFEEIKLDFSDYYHNQTVDNMIFDSEEDSIMYIYFKELTEEIDLPEEIIIDDYINDRFADYDLFIQFDQNEAITGVIDYQRDMDVFSILIDTPGTYKIKTINETDVDVLIICSSFSYPYYKSSQIHELEEGIYFFQVYALSTSGDSYQYSVYLEAQE